ncbi:hypothetical protein F5Y03DRAFT_328495 [Xylaria venustula]|nr:hypothetical protein F5Y03DRAFT_328495 [Xylaria venustula]
MEDDASNAHFQSIAQAATASWFAHRQSTPSSKQSSFIPQSSAHGARPSSIAAASLALATPAPPMSPTPPSVHPAATQDSSASTTPVSSLRDSDLRDSDLRDSETQPGDDVSANIGSDITAWKSALQSLPPEFADALEPQHPLAQALSSQPTLRPVEWNKHRVSGTFVPRTAHDFSSIMIYISGQVNPNPCRNCLLKNGPFALCVVSPPAVLANSTLRHACANCTYQNQYKKCTNDPISEQEKTRAELARSMVRTKGLTPRLPMTRKPKPSSRTKDLQVTQSEAQYRLDLDARQRKRKRNGRGDASIPQSPAGPGTSLGTNLQSFDEKLRHIRSCSPRTRRRIAADTLQWQAAIATIEAEDPVPATNDSFPSPLPRAVVNHHHHHIRAPLNTYTPSQLAPPSSAPAGVRSFAGDSPATFENSGYGAEHTYDAMDEDESEDEQEDGYEGTSWAEPAHSESIIKAPR